MNSRAFRKFKTEMGQANHFLITIMIGLDAVEDGAEKRESFKTTWNPRNRTNSVVRSKAYAIKSALAWTVDNLHNRRYDHRLRFRIPESKELTCP